MCLAITRPASALGAIILALLPGAAVAGSPRQDPLVARPPASRAVVVQRPEPTQPVRKQKPEQCVREVPSLIGKTRDAAAGELERSRLKLGAVESRLAPGPSGVVLDQFPRPPNIVACGSPVNIWIASEQPVVLRCAVPNVVGKDAKVALAYLRSAHLRPGQVSRRESDKPPGVVIDQDPQPDANVECGRPVALVLAVAPVPVVPEPVKVPPLRGETAERAQTLVADAGLKFAEAGSRPSDEQPGTVVDQFPLPDTPAQRGTVVQVWLAEQQVPVVPDLHGESRATAEDTLAKSGLQLGRVRERASNEPSGTVVDQLPETGSRVPRDSAVDVWIATAVVPANPVTPATPVTSAPSVPPTTSVPSGTSSNDDHVPWKEVLIGGAVACALAAGILSLRRARRLRLRGNVVLAPHPDPGDQAIGPEATVMTEWEFALQGSRDDGTQAVEGELGVRSDV